MSRSKSRFALSISAALTVLLAAGGADAGRTVPAADALHVVPRDHARKSAPQVVADAAGVRPGAKAAAPQTAQQIYIVELADAPVATYRGGVPGYQSTEMRSGRTPTNATSRGLLDTRSPASVAYAGYLEQRQAEVRQRLERRVGRTLQPVYSYKYVYNGLALRLTPAEAAQARRTAGVKSVHESRLDVVDTSDTPEFLGVPRIWDGSGTVTRLPAAMGEGMIVGLLDTGINHGNHSFAAVGDDGYEHVNPYGDGVFLGECNDFPGLCNNKLIGSYYFLEDSGGTDPLTPEGDPISKDTDGHGSHTASTAAGNQNDQATVYNVLGDDSGYSFGRISGMAPHANIIAYKVCAPSCGTSDRIAATEQAIQDGVNVLNHSIGSGSASPWDEPVANAFFNARSGGMFVAVSAGNDGPAPGTAARGINAPWTTSSGASTHWREIPDKLLDDLSGGDTPPPGPLSGKGITPGYTDTIVYAADYFNGDPDPEQCLTAFPPGTWNGEIVVCDRGTIARVLKCANVADGGAGGCILANIDGGATDVVADPHVIPAIHIDNVQGNALKAWLATGTGHRGTIEPTPDPIVNPEVADILADFSSRGPYTGLEFLVPSVAAPGVEVFAAGANLQFHHPGFDTEDPNDDPSVPGDYGIIGGTSMASPHTAGSSALLMQLHPRWTPAEIQSALMTTATTSMRKEDGVTPADPFDFGGGRIQPAEAARVGLVLDETPAHFKLADPASGGDPSTLNLASMVSNDCSPTCSWERTVRNATRHSVSYQVVGTGGQGMTVEVSPTSFTLAAGDEQTIRVNVDVTVANRDVFNFGRVDLLPESDDLPAQHLPIAALYATSTDPTMLTKNVDQAAAPPGATLTYEIKVTNSTPFDDVFDVSDVVPENAEFVPGSETEVVVDGETLSPWHENGGTITWSGRLDPTTNALVPSPAPFGFISMADLGVTPLGCPSNCDDGGFIIDGFNIGYQGQTYDSVIMSVNGVVEVGTASGLAASASNDRLPSPDVPNNLLAIFWTDMNLTDGGEWYAAVLDDGVNLYDVFSWESVPRFDDPTTYTYQIWAQEGSENIWFVYAEVPAIPSDNLTVGFENDTGTLGTSYFFDGEGTPPAVGEDLKITAIPGGSATLGFQAVVTGPIGDSILNVVEATSSSGTASALAATAISAEGDGAGGRGTPRRPRQ